MRGVFLAIFIFSTIVSATTEEKGTTMIQRKSNFKTVCYFFKGLKPPDESPHISIKDIKGAAKDIKGAAKDRVIEAESVPKTKSRVKRFNEKKKNRGDHENKKNKNLQTLC